MGAIAVLAFLLGVSLVLIVLITIKVVQIGKELEVISDRAIDLKTRVIELDLDVQEFKECFEEDIEEIYGDIDELKDSIGLLEDNSHPPVSEGGSTELKAQIEKLKKAFKKAMRK